MKEQKLRGTFTVDLKDLKQPWIDLCKEQGLVPGDVLRRVVEEMLGENRRQVPLVSLSKTGDARLRVGVKEARRERVEIRLLGSEYDRVVDYLALNGFENVPQWLVALVRAYLTHAPQFSAKEREVLGESNRQLLALGRNLNQISKAIHEQGLSGGEFTVERVDQLRVWINKHTETVSQMIAANVERWSVTNGQGC